MPGGRGRIHTANGTPERRVGWLHVENRVGRGLVPRPTADRQRHTRTTRRVGCRLSATRIPDTLNVASRVGRGLVPPADGRPPTAHTTDASGRLSAVGRSIPDTLNVASRVGPGLVPPADGRPPTAHTTDVSGRLCAVRDNPMRHALRAGRGTQYAGRRTQDARRKTQEDPDVGSGSSRCQATFLSGCDLGFCARSLRRPGRTAW